MARMVGFVTASNLETIVNIDQVCYLLAIGDQTRAVFAGQDNSVTINAPLKEVLKRINAAAPRPAA